ncbi:MAG: hypothetical protein K6E64_01780 [Lachnospiraceae bacterium]|nr:hypothetical protein [Lachnospiraceae bacterium]
MSINRLVTVELVEILVAYFLVVIVPPAIVFGEKLKKRALPYTFRLMAYLMIGNVFIINLVLYLTLFHLCNKGTLVLFSFFFYMGMALFLYQISLGDVLSHGKRTVEKLGQGYLGRKTFRAHIREELLIGAKRLFSGTVGVVLHHPLEVLGYVGTMVMVLYIFATNDYKNLGYTASDLPVHNYWINALGNNQPFVAGVYPMGYHCVVFFLHKVFGFDTYVLLRHWEVVTVVLLCSAIMAFVGYICKKHSFLAFFAVFVFALPGCLYEGVYARFLMGIPQEYAHVFILPALMFLLEFFERRKEKEEGRLVPSTLCWLLFSAGLSLTIAVHFYGAIVLLIFCLGVGVAYLPVIFKKEYFFSVLKSGLLGLLIAVLPMAISLMMGNHFQGSMGWALGVIQGSVSGTSNATNGAIVADLTDDDYSDDIEYYRFLEANGMMDDATQSQYEEVQIASGIKVDSEKQNVIANFIRGFYHSAKENLFWGYEDYAVVAYPIFLILCGVVLIGFFGFFFHWEFAKGYLATGIGVGILWIILSAKEFSLPSLMDENRTGTFLISFIGIIIAFGADALLNALLFKVKKKWIHTIVSLVLCLAVLWGFSSKGILRQPFIAGAYETNGAILCMESIMEENEDFTYTIVSAGDETQMVSDRGYHYEVSTFLKHLYLYKGGSFSDAYKDLEDADDGDIYIPTGKVYVFIEKIPLNHGFPYEGSGQRVSKEGASLPIPSTSSKDFYGGEGRWICMSKMYYWAKAYEQLIQDDMRVYYEDDEFICYEITQNYNQSYNFAIDYGYNDCGEGEIKLDD